MAANAFTDFNDGPKGFYTVFGKAFGELDELERKVVRAGSDDDDSNSDEDIDEDRPSFGGVAASASHVAKFYSYWTNFATKRKFQWCDKWRLSDVYQPLTLIDTTNPTMLTIDEMYVKTGT
jgi:hypothetical protein